jgi:hypothetical protein
MTSDASTSDRISDRIVRRAALGLTRRRFLRNASAAALAFSVGSALGGLRLAQPARAAGTPRHPCGRSPLCPKGRCYKGACSNAPGQYHGSLKCHARHNGGAWNEDYRASGRGWWHCTDCCATDGGGDRCSGCRDGHVRRSCICRKKIG